ncbi:SLC13 family permease [Streptomyces aidingensis]|uniref:Sodium-dependent dicarboxylate transporter SdcS n=1 Tax=Streptomyces aidingensis TaxID=910347 RepID=A0A1I1M593_9ACTN|nr:SLC13 family permease [Streptomyces aidingensis]SFC80206.1 solute carrier family 13 (sodium-dependent dicarboxylate transporter), member 2/3/5 [Streptomyces aidingensis]
MAQTERSTGPARAFPPGPGEEAGRIRPRRWAGLVAGAALAVLLRWALPDSLAAPDKNVAAVAALMAVWWTTEALPLPVTALVPLIAFPVLDVAPLAEAAGPYASPVIFLFLGGFLIAIAMQRWNLHIRFALATLALVGTAPHRMILGFMVATAVLSMWISNTATAVMMLPMGVAVLGLVARSGEGRRDRDFATALMLGIAYAATIGSLATVIGTPPNTLLRGFAEENFGIRIGFFQWMRFGVPLSAVFLVMAWLVLTKVVFRPGTGEIPGGQELIAARRRALGPVGRPEWTVLAVFLGAAVSWVLFPQLHGIWPWTERVDDTVIAITAALLLFALPVAPGGRIRALTWEDTRELPWGILLLFGGGLALSAAFSRDDGEGGTTGLGPWIGERVTGLDGRPVLLVVVAMAVLVLFLTELTSNTATAATFLPVMAGVAGGLGMDPMLLLLPVTVAASCAFMLPVATAPNALVFASGRVTIGQMARAGLWLNLIGAVLLTLALYALGLPVFAIRL